MSNESHKIKTDVIVFGCGSGWFNYLFDEVKNEPFFHIGSTYFSPIQKGRIINCLNRIVFGNRFGDKNRTDLVARLLIKSMCNALCETFQNGAICIINRTNYLAHNPFFLKKLKSLNNHFCLVYWFTDIVEAVRRDVPNIIDICDTYYDFVITYDKNDALKYNYKYVETPYSVLRDLDCSKSEVDLFYLGKAKLDVDPGRYEKLIAIFEAARKKGLKTDFSIVDVPEEMQRYSNEISFNNPLPYHEVLDRVSRSKCILEVSQKGESGTTLRMFEAIAYNKKLLFTNSKMIDHQYYDSRIMKLLVADPHGKYDIDIDFINHHEEKNEKLASLLSPYTFISAVEKIVKGEKNE